MAGGFAPRRDAGKPMGMAHTPVSSPTAGDPAASSNGRTRRAPRGPLLAGDDAVPRGLAVGSAIALRLLIIAGAIYLVGIAAGGLLLLVLPVVIALLLTTLLAPPANWLRRHHFRPAAASATMVLLTALFVLGMVGLIVPAVAAQLADLGTDLREGTAKASGVLAPLGIERGDVQSALDRAIESVKGNGGRIAGGVMTGALIAAEAAGAAILSLVLTFFFVKDGAQIWSWCMCLFADERRVHLEAMGERAWTVLSAYVRGVVAVATMDAVLIGLALIIVGVPLAVPLIVLTFLAAFFPIVGAVTAGVAAVLVALVAKGFVAAAIIAAVIIAVQQIEGHVFYPVIVGRRLALHPVAILLALTAGGTIAGIPGAFLSVPLAAVGAAVFSYAREQRSRQSPVVTP
jgi:putative heme transporter